MFSQPRGFCVRLEAVRPPRVLARLRCLDLSETRRASDSANFRFPCLVVGSPAVSIAGAIIAAGKIISAVCQHSHQQSASQISSQSWTPSFCLLGLSFQRYGEAPRRLKHSPVNWSVGETTNRSPLGTVERRPANLPHCLLRSKYLSHLSRFLDEPGTHLENCGLTRIYFRPLSPCRMRMYSRISIRLFRISLASSLSGPSSWELTSRFYETTKR